MFPSDKVRIDNTGQMESYVEASDKKIWLSTDGLHPHAPGKPLMPATAALLGKGWVKIKINTSLLGW